MLDVCKVGRLPTGVAEAKEVEGKEGGVCRCSKGR